MSERRGCDTCEWGPHPEACEHACQPPSPDHPEGVDAWAPSHYSTGRKFNRKTGAWEWNPDEFEEAHLRGKPHIARLWGMVLCRLCEKVKP